MNGPQTKSRPGAGRPGGGGNPDGWVHKILRDLACGRPTCRCRRIRANGEALVHCPAHPDERPSLSVRLAADGGLLVKCHAGCPQNRVIAELRARGLWPGSPNNQAGLEDGRDPAAWWAEHTGVPWAFWTTLSTEVVGGGVAFTWPALPGVRKIRLAGRKDYRWEPAHGPRPWLWPEVQGPLPEVVWLVEGEAEAGICRFLGLPAFTGTKGADAPPPPDALVVLARAGVRRVVVCFDADDAGRRGALKAAEAARQAGLEALVVDPIAAGCRPDLGLKDLRDLWLWFNRDPERLRQALEDALRQAEGQVSARAEGPAQAGARAQAPLRALTPAEILAEAPTGTLERLPVLGRDGLVIRGWTHVVAGPPKVGKTELLLACAREWAAAGLCVHWLSEEGLGVWAERFRRAGTPESLLVTPALGADPEELLAHAVATGADVVIIDTIRTLWRIDEMDNPVIAGMFARWSGAFSGRTIIFVHHQRKGGGQHGEGVAGGFAFVGSVDRVIEVVYDANIETRRRLRFLSRIEAPPELVYERDESGKLVIRGEPAAVDLEATAARCLEVLTEEWRTTKEVYQALAEPRPSEETVRKALHALYRQGQIQRDPAEERRGATYRWSLRPASTSNLQTTYVPWKLEVPPRPDGAGDTDRVQEVVDEW